MKKSPLFKPNVGTGKKFVKKRLYDDSSWTEYSMRFLQENPACYCCTNVARVTDHVKSHKGDEELFWNITNLIPLCKRCHDTVTGLFDRHAVPKTEEKMQWIHNQRFVNDITRKVRLVRR